jgi:hypothetical protein
MAVTVTAHVFSGRPDPTWTLSDKDAAEFQKHLDGLQRPTLAKPPGTLGLLGFRGFSVSGLSAGGGAPLDIYVHEGVVDRGSRFDVNVVDESRQLEQLPARGAPQHLPTEVLQHLTTEVARGTAAATTATAAAATATAAATTATPAAGTAKSAIAIHWPFPWPPITVCPPCNAVDAPQYNPMMWNIPGVQPFNNCYNYANNQITNTFAQPGRAHGQMYTVLQCNGAGAVEPAALADALIAAPNFTGALAAGKGWYVALVIWPGVDFHWYRQDKTGCWSHKPGGTAARNTDNSGNTITNPQTANRGPYVNFCTFMITTTCVVIN